MQVEGFHRLTLFRTLPPFLDGVRGSELQAVTGECFGLFKGEASDKGFEFGDVGADNAEVAQSAAEEKG